MPSHVIRRYGYNAETAELEVEFASGRRYRYHGIEQQVHDAMKLAFSKGSFFNQQIRDRYQYTRLEPAGAEPCVELRSCSPERTQVAD